MVLAGEAVDMCNSARRDLQAQLPVPVSSDNPFQAQDYLFQLDHISKTVCNVIDAAELCRSVHVSPEWRESANRAFATLSAYIGELNADTSLYQTLIKVKEADAAGDIQPPLTDEEKRFCLLLQAEFERDGIHLPDEERQEVQHLQSHVTQLETMFSQNIVHKKKEFQVEKSALEAIYSPEVIQANGIGPEIKSLATTSDSDVAQSLLKYSPEPQVRRQVHMESVTACPENLAVLDNLIHLRNEVAIKLGFASYADRFLRDKMAGSQEAVYAFLHKLLHSNQSAFKKEMEELADAKRKVENVQDGTLEPWDVSFYTSVLKARTASNTPAVSAYLTLDNCINGIQTLVDRLFGIQMIEREMTVEDAWDTTADSRTTSLRRLEFVDQDGTFLGTIYLDLKRRPCKYSHAAHFTVRCGCRLESPYGNGSGMSGNGFQRPIIALVCNLANFSNDGSSVLTHQEVETIYHELGHMLHSMLSRTQFQHLSGTRAQMDFVETPSHWLENFVWDPEFLRVLGRHHSTGEVIPDDDIQRLRDSRNSFHGIERQNQILYALFDQTIFGNPISSNSPTIKSTTNIFGDLMRHHGVPYAEGTHWHSRFGHLVTYGSGYYGYLYSQVFAEDIWKTCFEGNSMSRQAGERIWKKMLIHGGARDANLMLKDVLGRPSKVDS